MNDPAGQQLLSTTERALSGLCSRLTGPLSDLPAVNGVIEQIRQRVMPEESESDNP